MTAPAVCDDDLHAFADGRLDPSRRASIAAWLAENPDAAARVAAYQRINSELHRHFDPVMDEPLPLGMTVPPPARRSWRAVAGAAAAALVAGWLGGWLAHGAWQAPEAVERAAAVAPSIATQAAAAHAAYAPEVRHPVEVGADEETHLVRWLSNRMGHPIRAPRLESAGYRLMGGRLLPGAGGGLACQFMYESASGARITLFIRTRTNAEQNETAFRFAEEANGVGVFYWLDRSFGYALSATLPREQLLSLARLIYDQLNA